MQPNLCPPPHTHLLLVLQPRGSKGPYYPCFSARNPLKDLLQSSKPLLFLPLLPGTPAACTAFHVQSAATAGHIRNTAVVSKASPCAICAVSSDSELLRTTSCAHNCHPLFQVLPPPASLLPHCCHAAAMLLKGHLFSLLLSSICPGPVTANCCAQQVADTGAADLLQCPPPLPRPAVYNILHTQLTPTCQSKSSQLLDAFLACFAA
jgi:hypothetical protein